MSFDQGYEICIDGSRVKARGRITGEVEKEADLDGLNDVLFTKSPKIPSAPNS